ncbi:MAG: hypothetical protein QXU92_00240 [Candidatus Diapherotrites archaeon]
MTKSTLILSPTSINPTLKNFRVRGVFNPAAVRLKDNKILLFARIAETPLHGEKYFLAPRFVGNKELKIIVETLPRKKGKFQSLDNYFIFDSEKARLPTISHFRKILLDETGTKVLSISQKPDFFGLKDDGDFGVEDPRITFLKDEKKFVMTYVSVSMCSGVSTSLATSHNLETWKRHGIIFRQQNKDVVILPEKINGYYVALHRPEGTMIFDKPRIWISFSKDLIFWGKERPIMGPRKKGWDSLRIGSGTVPIRIKEGWLEIYHGVKLVRKKGEEYKVYSAGAVVFDKKMKKIIARSPENKPLFTPKQAFEKTGFVSNVVFPTSALQGSSDELLVFGGASDSCLFVRKLSIKKILESLVWEVSNI